MSQVFIFLLTLYQRILSPIIKNVFGLRSVCRFSPSCSQYAKESIEHFGVIRGTTLSVFRLLKCQPFTT